MTALPGVLSMVSVARFGRDKAMHASDDVAALVEQARGGSRDAFELLYVRHHRAVHAIVLARVSLQEADDLVQEVFADAWMKLHALRDPKAFSGWLTALARNRATDQARKRGHVAESEEISVAPPPRTEAEAALRAMRSLPETYRETLMMRLIEGLNGPEIAQRTGMTPESVRVNLHRGFKLLRELLEDEP